VKERRAHPRRRLDTKVVAASAPECALPSARAIDISRGGLLMAFVEPIGFVAGDRMLVTLPDVGFRFHARGEVVRSERGTDFRTYVALRFTDFADEDYDELCARLDARRRLAA
jgi:hypothetical protein